MFKTNCEMTWCTGCPDFLIKAALEKALMELVKEGYNKENFVLVTDIGCNSKIYDYLNVSAFDGLHGRSIPTAIGIHLGNPKLKVIVVAGDGATYNEGLSHFINACRYNADVTVLVFNNQIFSLTVGQATATSETGLMEKTHPQGVAEKPFNPILMALENGASFVARASASDLANLTKIIKEGIKHEGFSFIDILQPCLAFHDTSKFLKENSYSIQAKLFLSAVDEARKWDYCLQGKVALGLFFQERKKTLAEKYGLK